MFLKRLGYAASAAGILFAGISFAVAQADIQEEDINAAAEAKMEFPIAELGGCKNKRECKAYCDNTDNRRACIGFAGKHNLIKKEKLQKLEKRLDILEQYGGGPGGCASEEDCNAYCSDVEHMRECVTFAKMHGVMEPGEIEEAEKVLAAIDSGAKLPGGCTSKASCDLYCSNPDHMEECIAFAEQAGFMDAQELEEVRRILPLMQRGEMPGGCRLKEECESYCENPEHIEECAAFAEKAGFISKDEAEMMRKTGGRGPGGCRGRVECETYCNQPEHLEECFNFGAEHGLIPPEEIEQIRKMGGPSALKDGGPGGCRGKQECEAFCSVPEHQEQCFAFAVDNGLIPPEEVERINEMGGINAMRAGGPGGCMGEEECGEYCANEEHFEECESFGNRRDGGEGGAIEREFGGFAGPGGCASPGECLEFCKQQEHWEDCKNFSSGSGPELRDHSSGDEFPGRGLPVDDFAPPPGFDQGASQYREEGFEVPPGFMPQGDDFAPPPGFEQGAPQYRDEGFEAPPGFVPQGIDNIDEDLEQAHQDGALEQVRKIESILEESQREPEDYADQFQERREEMIRERVDNEFRAGEEEAHRRAAEEFQRRAGEQEQMRIEGNIFNEMPQGPEEFIPPSGGDFDELRQESRPLSLLRKVVTALLLFGL